MLSSELRGFRKFDLYFGVLNYYVQLVELNGNFTFRSYFCLQKRQAFQCFRFFFFFLSYFSPFTSNQGQNGLASVMTASVLNVFNSHSAFFFPKEVRNGSKQNLKIIL